MIDFIIQHWPLVILLAIGIPASIIDIRIFRIPDFLTIPGLVTALTIHILLGRTKWWHYLLNASSGFTLFFVVRQITRGKLGWGDIKYAAFLSALLGFFPWLDGMTIAVFLALGSYLFLLIIRKNSKEKKPIPFAPFLTLGALIRYGISGLNPWIN